MRKIARHKTRLLVIKLNLSTRFLNPLLRDAEDSGVSRLTTYINCILMFTVHIVVLATGWKKEKCPMGGTGIKHSRVQNVRGSLIRTPQKCRDRARKVLRRVINSLDDSASARPQPAAYTVD